ncbi:amino acid ABC transporter ATP-binding protein [Candidatus Dependentiae bacterium]|nr:amino acid ABC transporter ATP-binding protein [Candidatus Dependentiae bacterium]
MIKIKNLYKSFGSSSHSKQVLKNINLTIKKGEVVCVIGPSGSGKSTLLRMINRLELPSAGSVFIDNTELTETTEKDLVKKTGMVFQLFNLFENLTTLENVCYAPINSLGMNPAEANELGATLLASVGLGSKKHAKPASLSGGQKQRVGIARALAMRPEIMLFDEATSALDPEMVKEVLSVIKKLANHEMTIVLVTHEMGFANEIADRVLFMDHGEIIEDQPAKQFFTSPRHPRVKDFLSKIF